MFNAFIRHKRLAIGRDAEVSCIGAEADAAITLTETWESEQCNITHPTHKEGHCSSEEKVDW